MESFCLFEEWAKSHFVQSFFTEMIMACADDCKGGKQQFAFNDCNQKGFRVKYYCYEMPILRIFGFKSIRFPS